VSGDLIDDVDPFWAISDPASSHALLQNFRYVTQQDLEELDSYINAI
jgi:hypothetical protein